jgi:hypothetical protein
MFTQTFLRSLLSLGFNLDEKYIVPKQGNWFNPQDVVGRNPSIDTWCAFLIKDSKARTQPYYEATDDAVPVNCSVVQMISTVDLQLIGKYAEAGVQSMAHWNKRGDIEELLLPSGMTILPKGLGDYYVTNFGQDGLNSVLAYNTRIGVLWNSEIQTPQMAIEIINLPSGYVQIVSSGNIIITV